MLGHTKIRRPDRPGKFWSRNFKVQSGPYREPRPYIDPLNLLTPNQATAGDYLKSTTGFTTPLELWPAVLGRPSSTIEYVNNNLKVTAPAPQASAQTLMRAGGITPGLTYEFGITGFIADPSSVWKDVHLEFYETDSSDWYNNGYIDGVYTFGDATDNFVTSMIAPPNSAFAIIWIESSGVTTELNELTFTSAYLKVV